MDYYRPNQYQLTNALLMVRPSNFGFNEETADDNAFQSDDKSMSKEEISAAALKEFDRFVQKLRDRGIEVRVYEDTSSPPKPDAVFPNNWLSLHEDGTLITYPMYSAIRREERREDIIEDLEANFETTKRYSFDYYEEKKLYLEGTGSMLFDRMHRIVYATLSERTNVTVLEKFSVLLNYKKIVFNAVDATGKPIYHTNVLMALGKDFVIICLDAIASEEEKKELLDSFEATGKKLIEISHKQMNAFAGNMLQVVDKEGEGVLIMSEAAFRSLSPEQMQEIKGLTDILFCDIPIIEKYGGGSVRCMMAENFLPTKITAKV